MRRLNEEESGAVAVIMAVSLVVIFGMGALVVDVGNLYWERRQLQTGAEAAALAAAQDYAEGNGSAVALASARMYASANNTTDAHIHDDDTSNENDGFVPDLGASTITVTTQTGDVASPGTLQSFLARVIGVDAYATTASAVASWGYAGSLSTFPLTISTCEFDLEPDAGDPTTTYPPPHPNSIGEANSEKILFHQGGGAQEDSCDAQAGHDASGDDVLPAGFGWLRTDANCEVITTVVGPEEERWVDKDPGANPECSDDELAELIDTVVQIPVFNDFCRYPQDAGCPDYSGNDKYRIHTYASFYLRGYKLSGGSERGVHTCSGSERCIYGYFTDSVSLDGEGGGPAGSVSIVKLIG